MKRGFDIIIYYLKDGFDWKPGKTILSIQIESIIFFSYCLTKTELYYNSLKFEIVYFIWIYKRLYTILHFNNKYIVIFTDHEVIYNIVNVINLYSISTDRTNHCFANISVYLFIYSLDIYYIPGRLNLVPNIFSRL